MVTITPEIIIAIGTALAAVIASIATFVVSIRNGRRVEQVHILVNSKMTEAKEEIARLSKRLSEMTGDEGDKKRSDAASSEASHQPGGKDS